MLLGTGLIAGRVPRQDDKAEPEQGRYTELVQGITGYAPAAKVFRWQSITTGQEGSPSDPCTLRAELNIVELSFQDFDFATMYVDVLLGLPEPSIIQMCQGETYGGLRETWRRWRQTVILLSNALCDCKTRDKGRRKEKGCWDHPHSRGPGFHRPSYLSCNRVESVPKGLRHIDLVSGFV